MAGIMMVMMTRELSMTIIGARVTLASHKGHSQDMISPQKITVDLSILCKAAGVIVETCD